MEQQLAPSSLEMGLAVASYFWKRHLKQTLRLQLIMQFYHIKAFMISIPLTKIYCRSATSGVGGTDLTPRGCKSYIWTGYASSERQQTTTVFPGVLVGGYGYRCGYVFEGNRQILTDLLTRHWSLPWLMPHAFRSGLVLTLGARRVPLCSLRGWQAVWLSIWKNYSLSSLTTITDHAATTWREYN